MKLQFTIALLVLLTTLGCVSQQRLEKAPPFRISDPVVIKIIPGQEHSQQQLELVLKWDAAEKEQIIPDSIYFRGLVALSFLEEVAGTVFLKARFTITNKIKSDFIMDVNKKAEIGNQPPYPVPEIGKFPFQLDSNQAVLSYQIKGKKAKYLYKIEGIVEKTPIIMPAMPH